MLVQCPNCLTTYRVSDGRIRTAAPTFRCSRCKLIFVLELKPEVKPAEEVVSPSPTAPKEYEEEDRELSFSFPPSQADTAEEKDDQGPDTPEAAEGPLTDVEDHRPSPEPKPMSEKPFPPQEAAVDPISAPAQRPSETKDRDEPFSAILEGDNITGLDMDWELGPDTLAGKQGFTLEQEESATDAEVSPRLGGPLSIIPYIGLFGMLLLTFSLVTFVHQVQPAWVESFIKTIPWFGPLVLRNSHLQRGIVLRSLRSGFQTILGDREVFVVSGEVLNQNPVSVREVRLEGHIFNGEGKGIGHQAMSVGNAISSKIIRDMTPREIAILQRLSPQKRFKIPPEQSATFTIVFLKATRKITAFSCRVLSAEGAA